MVGVLLWILLNVVFYPNLIIWLAIDPYVSFSFIIITAMQVEGFITYHLKLKQLIQLWPYSAYMLMCGYLAEWTSAGSRVGYYALLAMIVVGLLALIYLIRFNKSE